MTKYTCLAAMCLLSLTVPALAQQAATAAPGALNLLDGAAWEFSSNGESWGAQPADVAGGKVETRYARTRFKAQPVKEWVALELGHDVPPEHNISFQFNDQDVPLPLAGMSYKVIPAIPPALLKAGENVLVVKIAYDNKPKLETDPPPPPITPHIEGTLTPRQAGDVRLQTGPILGPAGPTWFTLTCRTNLPVPMTLTITAVNADRRRPITRTSEAGLFHRFKVEGLNANTQWEYSLSVDKPPYKLAATPPRPVKLIPQGDKLHFMFMGDCRSRPKDWETVVQAALKEKPQFVVFTGDMTTCGRYDWLWDEEFCGPAAELLATTPLYAIMGNHEENAPICSQLLWAGGPNGKDKNWFQQVGPVLLLYFDTQYSQTRDRDFPAWFKTSTAQAAAAKYVFYFTHYPAWTAGKGTTNDPKTGLPKHSGSRFARTDVLPQLVKLKATAMFTAHEHMYERSELPEGITHIVTGGAGAPRGRMGEEGKQQNPHMKVLQPVLHFCVLDTDGQKCVMRALAPDGKELDTRTWQARPAAK